MRHAAWLTDASAPQALSCQVRPVKPLLWHCAAASSSTSWLTWSSRPSVHALSHVTFAQPGAPASQVDAGRDFIHAQRSTPAVSHAGVRQARNGARRQSRATRTRRW